MDKNEKERLIEGLFASEAFHNSLFHELSRKEKANKTKIALERLAKLEKKHSDMWGSIMPNDAVRSAPSKIKIAALSSFNRIFGIGITMKVIEHQETNLKNKLQNSIREFSEKERSMINKIKESEEKEEEPLEKSIIETNRFFRNVRDIMFGMNDGLVELLAVVVGLAAALENPILIFIAGFIVAISGTLSMAAGAYLSTDYQNKIDGKVDEKAGNHAAIKSGFYVGIFYFIGTLFPLSPFIFGSAGYMGIAIAIIITGIVLTITSALISLVSDRSIIKGVAKTLAISLGVAVITIILGSYIRSTFHITV
jgi:VIT1/CCC1 family predicted Fe2+/Mn2+ transporter